MILATGLTPAWQQILSFDRLVSGSVNRAKRVDWCASGKVLNVGLALQSLGSPVRTLAVVGGKTGEAIQQEFAAQNVPARWILSQTPTRVCTTLLESHPQQTTELVENSGPLRDEELARFLQTFAEEASEAEFVVLSGSLPAGVPVEFYRRLMDRCKSRVVLDASGPELSTALEGKPFLVKPNRDELARTVGRDLTTEAETLAAMRELNDAGAEWVVVSQGPRAVLASSGTTVYRLVPPVVPVVNPIGCGDCMAAGLTWGFQAGLSDVEALQLGLAAAGDNLSQHLPARLDPQRVRQLAQTVAWERI